jgi:DNA-directed RNA polymerase specialized sigma24 family protein
MNKVTDAELELYTAWLYSIAKDFEQQARKTSLAVDDLFQEALLATVLALKDHDPSVNPDKRPIINKYVRQRLYNVIRANNHTETFVGVGKTDTTIDSPAAVVIDFLEDMENACSELEYEFFRLKVEGYSIQEIMDKMNLSTGAIRKLMYRLNCILEELEHA